MKRLFLIIYFFVIASALQAQNYQTIYSSRPSIWNSNASSYYSNTLISYYDFNNSYVGTVKPYFGISVDSIKVAASDTILFNYQILYPSAYLNTFYFCNYVSGYNWIGNQVIIKQNGENIFFNKAGDTIIINTSADLNNTWHFYDFADSSFVEATVTADTIQSFLGITDSVKIITLNIKTKISADSISPINGKQIILSKYNGFIQALNFYNFPNDTSWFSLIGITNPALGIQNITAKDIFNYEIGDELDIVDRTTQAKMIVIDKTTSLNADTITYQYQRQMIGLTFNAPLSLYFQFDTLTEQIILSNYSYLNGYPQQLISMISTDIGKSNYNNRPLKCQSYAVGNQNGIDSCYYDLRYGPNGPNGTYGYSFYIMGLGGPYFAVAGATDIPDIYYTGDYEISIFNQTYVVRLLQYYKKGSETWGTPYDFSAYSGITPSASQQIAFTVFPNPFSESTTVKISNNQNASYQLKVLDANGKTLKEYNFSGNEQKISSDNLTPGMYYFLITNANGQSSSGKLVVY